jgi:thymidylate synthase
MITKIVAQLADLELGHFSHTVVDAHIYCGKGERGEWYSKNLEELKNRVKKADKQGDYLKIKKWIEDNAPSQEKPFDHVTGLLKQLSREPKERPKMEISKKPIDELKYEDFELSDYNPHPGIKFAVAE